MEENMKFANSKLTDDELLDVTGGSRVIGAYEKKKKEDKTLGKRKNRKKGLFSFFAKETLISGGDDREVLDDGDEIDMNNIHMLA